MLEKRKEAVVDPVMVDALNLAGIDLSKDFDGQWGSVFYNLSRMALLTSRYGGMSDLFEGDQLERLLKFEARKAFEQMKSCEVN